MFEYIKKYYLFLLVSIMLQELSSNGNTSWKCNVYLYIQQIPLQMQSRQSQIHAIFMHMVEYYVGEFLSEKIHAMNVEVFAQKMDDTEKKVKRHIKI